MTSLTITSITKTTLSLALLGHILPLYLILSITLANTIIIQSFKRSLSKLIKWQENTSIEFVAKHLHSIDTLLLFVILI